MNIHLGRLARAENLLQFVFPLLPLEHHLHLGSLQLPPPSAAEAVAASTWFFKNP